MACIHCVSVVEYPLVLVVAALLGRHLVTGLGLALEGVILGKSGIILVDFYVVWGAWEAANTSKHIFFCQWKRVWFATYIT